jgi:hypothetical protein
MFDDINQSIEGYKKKWDVLVEGRRDRAFFDRLLPTAIGWKGAAHAEFERLFLQWLRACDHIDIAWLNDRYIATMHLKDAPLAWNISIIKLMERRPGSTDTIGLDHVDFHTSEPILLTAMEAKEPELKWTAEVNGISVWTSLWFDDTEAKLRNWTVLSVASAELHIIEEQITGRFPPQSA